MYPYNKCFGVRFQSSVGVFAKLSSIYYNHLKNQIL